MVKINLHELIGRLNSHCNRSLEAAFGLCQSRSNYDVEPEHWLLKLFESSNSDAALIAHHFKMDIARITKQLTQALDRLQTGSGKLPSFSPGLFDLMRNAWLLGSIDFQDQRIRSGHVLCALAAEDAQGLSNVRELEKISFDELRKQFRDIIAKSEENIASGETTGGSALPAATAAGAPGKAQALNQFTIDLTAQAREGKIDPVLGRDAEIRQIIDILTRRRQNNPILTGEAGVGKTAVAEGFALRVAAGDVPPPLRNICLRTLDLGLLQAGAGIKGEFENRLKTVITEVKASPIPIVLFIDEAHTLIGAGGQAGQGDAANLLKPALARGELRTIAATTWAEYKKYFEKDAALARRFQVVKVEEPSEESAIEMMRGLTQMLEKHHNVRVLNEAIVDAVRLSSRYLWGRQLPDKSVSVLDTTCARVGISQSATPPAVEDSQRRIAQIETKLRVLRREAENGANHAAAITAADEELSQAKQALARLDEQWQAEKKCVERIHELHGKLTAEAEVSPPVDRDRVRSELAEAEAELKRLQGEAPLMHPCVDGRAVADTIAGWTGIPLRRMLANEVRTMLRLEELLEESIVGQTHALQAIAKRIRTSRAGLSDPRMPIGVFLLAGTSGVGKTETAISLANLLYGGEQNMTVLNMSEFKEEHKVSLLMGSPPGYVGYGEGGVLTEAVRRKPYSVLLLDEMEKAHPGVQDIFYQVFDKGMMKDGEGRDIDFKNTVIFMTSNAGSDVVKGLCSDPETRPEPDAFAQALFPELLKTFKPAFLGRLTVVPYYPLSDEVMKRIIVLKLGKIRRRVLETYGAKFEFSTEVIAHVARRCTEVDTGARNVDHILTGTLLPELSAELLGRLAAGQSVNQVEVNVGPTGSFAYAVS